MITAGDTIDVAMLNAAEILAFAAEDWSELAGEPFPAARTIDECAPIQVFRTASSTHWPSRFHLI